MQSGEIETLLEDLKLESSKLMSGLTKIEENLVELQEYVLEGNLDREKLLNDIQKIRQQVGLLENVDNLEYNEEETIGKLITNLHETLKSCF
jgi:hypothetical protein